MIPLAAIEGKYEILKKISEGGMGAVYKVRHRFLDELRVIKVMRPHLAADEKARNRFEREAKLAGSLHHANIARLYDYAIDEAGNAYLVLEFIEGVTLQELLKEIGTPPIGLTLAVARQVLAALGLLHQRGIVHRDISPDNIMVGVDENGTLYAKLIDLGIAKMVEADGGLTATGMFVGKVKYSSPEHFKAPEGVKVDARSDLYSLGVVLYEMLTGQHPIPGSGVSNLIAGHLFHSPEPFARADPECRVPPDLQSIVFRTMSKKPSERPTDAAEMARLLAEVHERFDTPLDQLSALLAKRRAEAAASLPADPGSTQWRLDRHFGEGTTPPPKPHLRALTPPGTDVPTAELGMSVAATGVVTPARARGMETVAATQVFEEAESPQEVAPRRMTAARIVALVAAVVVALVAVILAMRGQPAAGPPGVLVIDAVPWAEITSVVDQSGKEVELQHPSYTPLRLSVPPGSYRIVVRSQGSEQELSAEVASSEAVHRLARFAEVDADAFLHDLGL